ncbi:MAG: endonuclease domain-containing protein [Solirubrobacteraceae bacterium]
MLALERALARRPGAKGRAKLRAILEDYTGAPPTRSVFERVLLELIEKAGLPKPLVNAKLAGLEPDIYWPQWKLVVELDSRRFHSDPRTFESDRIREARLQRLGLRVLRITWKRLKHEPQAVIDDILALARLSAPLDALSGGALDSLGLARNR